MTFKKFMTSKLTIAAIIFAIIYQFIMAIVYLPGYKHSTDHLDKLRVALVNENQEKMTNKMANNIADGIHYKHNSPKVKTYSSLTNAKNDLKDKKVLLVIDIPKNIAKNISQGKQIHLNYFDNKYSDSFSNSAMNRVKSGVDYSLNKTFTELGNTKVLTTMMMKTQGTQIIKEKMMQALQANPVLATNPASQQQLQKQITDQVTTTMEKQAKKYVITNPVQTHLYTISNNHSSNPAIVLGVMMLALGCFISVMAASILEFSEFENALLQGSSRLKAFMMYETAFLMMSIFAPIVSILTFKLVTHIGVGAAVQLYGQNVLMTFVSAQFVSIFTLLLGRVGLLINLPVALIQTLISGAIMPFSLLPTVYRFFYYILPLPYNYMSNMSILSDVNRSELFNYDLRLVMLGLVAGVIALGISLVRKYHTKINENVS